MSRMIEDKQQLVSMEKLAKNKTVSNIQCRFGTNYVWSKMCVKGAFQIYRFHN